jgi:hypothetical protein
MTVSTVYGRFNVRVYERSRVLTAATYFHILDWELLQILLSD